MIVLWDESPLWQELLRQEGVSFRPGPQLGDRDVVILNRGPGKAQAQAVRHHVESGGGLLAAGADAVSAWLDLKPPTRRLHWIAPEGDSLLFRNVVIVDIEARGCLLSEANVGTTDSGAKAILATMAGRGSCVLLPFDVAGVLGSVVSGPRQFPATAPRFPYDTVARTSRGEVRRLVANSLRFLLARQGLPYVHLASFPLTNLHSPSTFAFRVDTDFGPRRDLEAVARLAERVGMKFSWYVNVGAHQVHFDLFADLARQGHDIQLHCFRHAVYPDYARNYDNFRRGKEKMDAAGLTPVGVVAPFGEWNPNLSRALEALGFEYSSEFCVAYDDLPFRPVVGGRPSRVLQVPVHPICLGRLVAARANHDQMTAYYRSVIDRQAARREPCFLYDHPERIAQFSDLLAEVLGYAKERCGSVTTMTEYARWWQRRERFSYSVSISDKTLEVTTESDDRSLSIEVERDGQYALLPGTAGAYPLSELEWRPLPEPVRFDPNTLAARRRNLLLYARSFHRRVMKNLQGQRG